MTPHFHFYSDWRRPSRKLGGGFTFVMLSLDYHPDYYFDVRIGLFGLSAVFSLDLHKAQANEHNPASYAQAVAAQWDEE